GRLGGGNLDGGRLDGSRLRRRVVLLGGRYRSRNYGCDRNSGRGRRRRDDDGRRDRLNYDRRRRLEHDRLVGGRQHGFLERGGFDRIASVGRQRRDRRLPL